MVENKDLTKTNNVASVAREAIAVQPQPIGDMKVEDIDTAPAAPQPAPQPLPNELKGKVAPVVVNTPTATAPTQLSPVQTKTGREIENRKNAREEQQRQQLEREQSAIAKESYKGFKKEQKQEVQKAKDFARANETATAAFNETTGKKLGIAIDPSKKGVEVEKKEEPKKPTVTVTTLGDPDVELAATERGADYYESQLDSDQRAREAREAYEKGETYDGMSGEELLAYARDCDQDAVDLSCGREENKDITEIKQEREDAEKRDANQEAAQNEKPAETPNETSNETNEAADEKPAEAGNDENKEATPETEKTPEQIEAEKKAEEEAAKKVYTDARDASLAAIIKYYGGEQNIKRDAFGTMYYKDASGKRHRIFNYKDGSVMLNGKKMWYDKNTGKFTDKPPAKKPREEMTELEKRMDDLSFSDKEALDELYKYWKNGALDGKTLSVIANRGGLGFAGTHILHALGGKGFANLHESELRARLDEYFTNNESLFNENASSLFENFGKKTEPNTITVKGADGEDKQMQVPIEATQKMVDFMAEVQKGQADPQWFEKHSGETVATLQNYMNEMMTKYNIPMDGFWEQFGKRDANGNLIKGENGAFIIDGKYGQQTDAMFTYLIRQGLANRADLQRSGLDIDPSGKITEYIPEDDWMGESERAEQADLEADYELKRLERNKTWNAIGQAVYSIGDAVAANRGIDIKDRTADIKDDYKNFENRYNTINKDHADRIREIDNARRQDRQDREDKRFQNYMMDKKNQFDIQGDARKHDYNMTAIEASQKFEAGQKALDREHQTKLQEMENNSRQKVAQINSYNSNPETQTQNQTYLGTFDGLEISVPKGAEKAVTSGVLTDILNDPDLKDLEAVKRLRGDNLMKDGNDPDYQTAASSIVEILESCGKEENNPQRARIMSYIRKHEANAKSTTVKRKVEVSNTPATGTGTTPSGNTGTAPSGNQGTPQVNSNNPFAQREADKQQKEKQVLSHLDNKEFDKVVFVQNGDEYEIKDYKNGEIYLRDGFHCPVKALPFGGEIRIK